MENNLDITPLQRTYFASRLAFPYIIMVHCSGCFESYLTVKHLSQLVSLRDMKVCRQNSDFQHCLIVSYSRATTGHLACIAGGFVQESSKISRKAPFLSWLCCSLVHLPTKLPSTQGIGHKRFTLSLYISCSLVLERQNYSDSV